MGPRRDGASVPDAGPASRVLLRPLFFNAAAERVRPELQGMWDLQLYITPVDEDACTVFGYVSKQAGASELETVRRCNRRLTEARRALEAGAKQ